jgi:hypothetical protein
MKHTIIPTSAVVAIVLLLLGGSFAMTLESTPLKKSVSTDTVCSSYETINCAGRAPQPNVPAIVKAPHNNQAVSSGTRDMGALSGDRGRFYAYDCFTSVFFNFDPINSSRSNWFGQASWWISGSDFDQNGNWYAVSHDGGLYQVDPDTLHPTFIASTTSLNSLVYDTVDEVWYACSADSNGIDSLFTINVSTGAETFVGHFGTSTIMISLMCDTDGNMYSYDVLFGGDSHLYSIDKNTGEATVIGDMGYNFCYAQEGKFDRNTGILYLTAYSPGSSPSSFFAVCDPATGEVTILNYFNPNDEIDAFTAIYGDPSYYPHAEFTWTPPDPHPGDAVLFNASGSYDYDGHITLYEWDWNNDGVFEESHTTPTATHSWDDPGDYTVVVRVTDNASLTGEKSRTLHVEHADTTPPVTAVTFSGTIGNEGWYIDPVLVTLTAVDNESGVNYTMYDLDNGTWTLYTAPFGVSAEGRHTLRFYSVDNAGNVEATQTGGFKIDLVPPVTSFSVSGNILMLTAVDYISGVNHTYYKLHDADPWTEYTGPAMLPDGNLDLFFYSVDHAGNTEMIKGPFFIKIDHTPPVFINFTATPENLLKNKWLLNATVSDPASGVARVEFYIDGHLVGNVTSPNFDGSWSYVYQGKGKTAQAIAYDNAGNSAMSNQVQTNELIVNCQPMALNQIVDVQSDTSVVVNMQHMLHGEKLNS